jgi:hypothetical protein
MAFVGYPNVDAAGAPRERDALDKSFDKATRDCESRGCDAQIRAFECDVRDNSKAVISKTRNEVVTLASSENQMVATYFGQIRGGVRLPDGNDWDVLRRIAGAALFCGYEDHIQFGLLSLDERGSSYYGDMHLVLRTELISDRASTFVENSAAYVKPFPVGAMTQLPPGMRADWAARGKLAAAKIYRQIDQHTNPSDHACLLMRPGAAGSGDDFVEVHIYGTLSIKTVGKVVCAIIPTHAGSKRRQRQDTASNAELAALRERLGRWGVTFEEVVA